MDSINISLGIPCINVEKNVEKQEQNNNGDFIITVSSTAEGTLRSRCGKQINKLHCHDRETEFRHLSILGHKTYIRIRPKRYECPYCEGCPTTTQKTSWYDPKSPNTRAYEDHILLPKVGSTVSDVSMKEDMGYEAVMGIIGRRIKGEVNQDNIGRLDSLRIDEITLKKGHKDFVTIIASYIGDHPKISGVVEGREKKTVRKSKNMARRKIEVWVEVADLCGMKCSESFFSTLKKRMEKITNYFIGRQSGGFPEGSDNKIKVIKRRCYGIFNVRHLFQRIFLDLEGYSLFGFHCEI